MAEGVGFEPTDPCGSPVFKTGPLSHSGIPPRSAPRLDFDGFYLTLGLPVDCRLLPFLPKSEKYANDGTGTPNIANTSV